MTKYTLIVLLLLLACSICNAQTVTDIDGNIYETIKIGQQIWMVENLETTRFNNGDPVINLTKTEDWTDSKKAGYRYHNYDSLNSYGLIYKNNIVYDKRNVRPVGWRIPSSNDFTILSDYFGGEEKVNNEAATLRLKSSPKWIEIFNVKLLNDGYFKIYKSVYYWVKDEGKLPGSLVISPATNDYKIRGESGWSGYFIRCIKEN